MENIEDILTLDLSAEIKNFKKGSILQREGDTPSKTYFVKKGLLRSYTIDNKGKEHIFIFASEGWIISDIESQEFNHPAELFIECIEDSEVYIIDRKRFTLANLSTNQLEENVRLLIRRNAVLQKRVIMLMSATAKERYQNFLETYPLLPNRIPQKMIASYLGITPESLSKIRGEISRESD